ncbi:regulatory protein GemA [Pseudomonas sp. F1_0610]|uniref:gp16 family protein n=1 Tax=Pseudomonas sp. F1_0610 TaxID=3114284 RepID=UPI0039C1D62B
MSIKRIQLAKIHIAKAQLSMDDDSYRAMLARVAGVKSAKELNPRQIGLVMAEFERLGFTPKATNKGREKPNVTDNKQSYLNKIEALLADAKRPWSYADSMAKHMFKVERVEWLDESQTQRLMQALIIDAKRHEV